MVRVIDKNDIQYDPSYDILVDSGLEKNRLNLSSLEREFIFNIYHPFLIYYVLYDFELSVTPFKEIILTDNNDSDVIKLVFARSSDDDSPVLIKQNEYGEAYNILSTNEYLFNHPLSTDGIITPYIPKNSTLNASSKNREVGKFYKETIGKIEGKITGSNPSVGSNGSFKDTNIGAPLFANQNAKVKSSGSISVTKSNNYRIKTGSFSGGQGGEANKFIIDFRPEIHDWVTDEKNIVRGEQIFCSYYFLIDVVRL